jgi:hypothetical protein
MHNIFSCFHTFTRLYNVQTHPNSQFHYLYIQTWFGLPITYTTKHDPCIGGHFDLSSVLVFTPQFNTKPWIPTYKPNLPLMNEAMCEMAPSIALASSDHSFQCLATQLGHHSISCCRCSFSTFDPKPPLLLRLCIRNSRRHCPFNPIHRLPSPQRYHFTCSIPWRT